MILRLAVRSLAVRPLRTAVLAAGFGLGIAVMAALLGVGEVIIEQAHAPALRGGGDLVVSGAFGPIESARFVLSNVIRSPGLQARVRSASPARKASLYLIKPGRAATPVAVRGGIPSLEQAAGDHEVVGLGAWSDQPSDASWSHPQPEDVLRAMDRFHPVPEKGIGTTDPFFDSWAEWLYFNGHSADGRLRFYLTFMAGATNDEGKRPTSVRLQLNRDGRTTNYVSTAIVDARQLLDHAPDLDVGGNRIRLDGTHYRITLALAAESGAPYKSGAAQPSTSEVPLVGDITLDASLGRSLPPAEIHGARGWLSGYVVPVLSGRLHGRLRVGDDVIALEGASGYHDHNWGFWEGVRWQWGQVADGDLSIVFGRVFPPESVADPDRVPGFAAVLGPNGPIAFSTHVTIVEDDDGGAPRRVAIQMKGPQLDVRLTLAVEETVASRMPLLQRAEGTSMTFLQLGGVYSVDGRAGDRTLGFTARGAAETFRQGR